MMPHRWEILLESLRGKLRETFRRKKKDRTYAGSTKLRPSQHTYLLLARLILPPRGLLLPPRGLLGILTPRSLRLCLDGPWTTRRSTRMKWCNIYLMEFWTARNYWIASQTAHSLSVH